MSFTISTNSDYDTISFQGSVTLSALPVLTPQLSNYFQNYSPNDLVIDLSDTVSIDSSIIRVFLNLKKRIESNKNRLYLLHPCNEILSLLKDANLDKVLTILSDINELYKIIDKSSYDRFLPFTYAEKDLKRLRCSCGACGSQNVVGYLLSPMLYKWEWRENDLYPYSKDANNAFFDYYSTLPIVCAECFMASIDISHFNLLDETNKICHKSVLDDKTKLHLSKSSKKRRKMMENIVLPDNYFFFPRNHTVSFQIYLLAEMCSKSVAINECGINSFIVGYLNFLALQFSSDDQKEEIINNCRTWLIQVMTEPNSFSKLQIAQTYYMLMVVSLMVEKLKDATKYYNDFSSLMESIPTRDKSQTELNSPSFWFVKAEMIWKKEIEKKSHSFRM